MKVLLSLACAAAIVAAPASAADLLGTAAPLTLPASQGPLAFEVGSNWYVRGDLGISFDVAPTVSLAAISAPPPGFAGSPLPVYSGQNIHATDFTGGVGAGYRFNNYLRFDAHLGLPHRARRIEQDDGRLPLCAHRSDEPSSA